MQAVTDAQAALLTGNRLECDFGAEVLNLDLTLATDYGTAGDISEHVRGGSVSWNGDAKIHRTCSLDLSLELPWGSVLVRPWQEIGGERWYVGAFMLTTPEKPVGESPATFSCQGYDRLYLLDREIGADYTVTSGTSYRAALTQLFTDAGLSGVQIEGAAADYTLPVDRVWPLVATSSNPDENVGSTPVTFLRAVNDLQQAWNGRGVWCDEAGVFRCQAYQEPSVRPSEWTFDADAATTVVGEDRTVVSDIWKAPNRWVVLWSNRPGGAQAVEGDGMWTYDLPDSDVLSAVNRGLTWTKVYEYEAASQTVLEAIGARRVANDRRLSTAVSLSSSPLPIASHADVVTIVDAAAGLSGKASASSWKLPLDGSDMQWTFEMVSL